YKNLLKRRSIRKKKYNFGIISYSMRDLCRGFPAVVALFLINFGVKAEVIRVHRTIEWSTPAVIHFPDERSILRFSGAGFDPVSPSIPDYCETIILGQQAASASASLINPVFIEATDAENVILRKYFTAGKTLSAVADISCEKKIPVALIKIFPLRFNSAKNK